jgi:hypothetical protein
MSDTETSRHGAGNGATAHRFCNNGTQHHYGFDALGVASPSIVSSLHSRLRHVALAYALHMAS